MLVCLCVCDTHVYVYCAACDMHICDKSKVVVSVNKSDISVCSLHEVCMCVTGMHTWESRDCTHMCDMR